MNAKNVLVAALLMAGAALAGCDKAAEAPVEAPKAAETAPAAAPATK